MDKLYCCYSLNLRNFLYQNGLKYELAAKNPNSDKLFWVYIKDKKLDELLTRWTAKEQSTFYVKILEVTAYGKRKIMWNLLYQKFD